MARKAKRRGRPPGSKNKKTLTRSVSAMDLGELRSYIDDLRSTLARKVAQQREYFEGQLAQLSGYTSKKASAPRGAAMARTFRADKRAKPKPKYQSKKNKTLKWSGRGMTPVWMRDEMKGTKLTKDSFLIKQA